MPLSEIIPLIAQSGGALALGIFAIYMLDKAWQERTEEAQEYAKQIKVFKDCMVDVNRELIRAIEKNTAAFVEFSVMLRRWEE